MGLWLAVILVLIERSSPPDLSNCNQAMAIDTDASAIQAPAQGKMVSCETVACLLFLEIGSTPLLYLDSPCAKRKTPEHRLRQFS